MAADRPGGQQFDYLTDVHLCEYRDPELPLRSLPAAFALPASRPARQDSPRADARWIESVVDLWHGANWLRARGVRHVRRAIRGHPECAVSEWETYYDGDPLRKRFRCAGGTLAGADPAGARGEPEAHYSMEELSILPMPTATFRATCRTGSPGRSGVSC